MSGQAPYWTCYFYTHFMWCALNIRQFQSSCRVLWLYSVARQWKFYCSSSQLQTHRRLKAPSLDVLTCRWELFSMIPPGHTWIGCLEICLSELFTMSWNMFAQIWCICCLPTTGVITSILKKIAMCRQYWNVIMIDSYFLWLKKHICLRQNYALMVAGCMVLGCDCIICCLSLCNIIQITQ